MKGLLWILCLPTMVFGWASFGLFKEFPNRYFVETGSFEGYGIIEATRSGFLEIYSIELSPRYYDLCKKEFAHLPHVHLWLGDSSILLEEMIQDFREPATFWLDSHYTGPHAAKGMTNTPILQELAIIKKHPIKNHTILIDDVRLFGSEEFDYVPLSLVIEKLLEINPEYAISFRNGFQKGDVLVAIPPASRK